MIVVSVAEAKTQLSRLLQQVMAGETILLTRHNRPIAEIRPLPERPKEPRPVGLARGQFTVGPEFFEPLPDELLEAFEGR